MDKTEARYWLQQKPDARPTINYVEATDEIITSYVPQLGGKDVALAGHPIKFESKDAALREAIAFQKAIRSNHSELA